MENILLGKTLKVSNSTIMQLQRQMVNLLRLLLQLKKERIR